MDSSTYCPSPVRCFCAQAAVIASAACTPVPASPMVGPGRMGGPSGSPVIENAPGRSLGDHVHALVVRIRSAGAEALDAHVDDLGIHGAHGLVADVEFLHHSRAVVLHEDVVVGDHFHEHVATCGRVEVQGHAALIAVPVDEVLGVQGFAPRAPTSGVADLGPLDLDDVGTEEGEALRAGRAGLVLGHVENAHSVESCHKRLLMR